MKRALPWYFAFTAMLFATAAFAGQDISAQMGISPRGTHLLSSSDSIDLNILGSGGNFSLHWVVPPELSCLTFRIERAWSPEYRVGADTRWVEVGDIPGICNVFESVSYSYVDQSSRELRSGTVQYRLSVRTTGGEQFYTYAPAVLIAVPARMEIVDVHPQPASGHVRISLAVPAAETMDARVYDLRGRIVHDAHALSLEPGLQSLSLDLSSLPAGMYMYELRSASTIVQRLLRIAR